MKRVFVFIVSCLFVFGLSAKTAKTVFSFGAGYTNYVEWMRIDTDYFPDDVELLFSQPPTVSFKEAIVHAAAMSVGVYSQDWYGMVNFSFPEKTPTALTFGQELEPGSFIFDIQGGSLFSFFPHPDLRIAVGGGASFSVSRMRIRARARVSPGADPVAVELSSVSIFSGISALLTVEYFFSKHFGIGLSISETLNVLPITSFRQVRYKGDMYISPHKEWKFNLSNIFTVRFGPVIRF